MKLNSLHLENFRNYARLDFAFPDEPIVILSGENAQGKTNFLEAMYMMAITKSFRMGDREFLKQFDKDYFRIEAKGVSEGQSQAEKTGTPIHLEMCEITTPQHQRVLKKNGTKISAPKFLGHLKAVLFRPEDLHILTGEPALRRKYLNTILIQTVPGYMRQMQTYQKLLSQRNALLLQIKLGTAPASALDIWDPPLAEAGAALLTSRLELIDFLRKQLCEQVGETLYQIDYVCFLHSSASTQLQNELQSLLLQALTQNRSRDTRSTHTSVGPHRDDLKLKIRGYPLELIASRGELRSALMALKQAEIAWFTRKTGETPIILLDDIFSELDSNRKNDIFEPIFNGILAPLLATTQVIMTVAQGNPLPTSPKLRSASTVRKVHEGQITQTQ